MCLSSTTPTSEDDVVRRFGLDDLALQRASLRLVDVRRADGRFALVRRLLPGGPSRGALASRAEDLQATATPLTFLVMVVFFGAFLFDGNALTVASYVPPFSCVLMPIRLLGGDAAGGSRCSHSLCSPRWRRPWCSQSGSTVVPCCRLRAG